MINLEDLSWDDRTLITIQCESFFLDYTETKSFNKIHSDLVKLCKKVNQKEVWLIVSACAKALKYGNIGSQISLNSEDYKTANKVSGKKLSYRKTLKVLSVLEDNGYLSMYKGFRDLKNSISIKSCFIMKDKLVSMFEDVNVSKFGMKRDPLALVEIRDMKTKEPITDLSKLRGIKSERELVMAYNTHLQAYDIRVKGRKAVTVYKRVYADDLTKAGRWYSFGGLQTASKELRPTITINGVKCTEVDFAQIHPRILYTLEGISKPMNFEPYSVKKGTVVGDSKECRKFLKMAMMCLLYAKSKKSAIAALVNKLKDDKLLEKEERVYHLSIY